MPELNPYESPKAALKEKPGERASPLYRAGCLFLALLGWTPILFARPMMHGGGWADVIAFNGGMVLGAYAALELARRSRYPERALWVAILLPYAVGTIALLFLALPYLPRIFGG